MKKALQTETQAMAVGEPIDLLQQKTELATRAIDSLMFTGQVGNMVTAMAQMAGIPEISVALLFPSKKPANMRRFLACLNWIITTVLDDQADLEACTLHLADAVDQIRSIMEEEK